MFSLGVELGFQIFLTTFFKVKKKCTDYMFTLGVELGFQMVLCTFPLQKKVKNTCTVLGWC